MNAAKYPLSTICITIETTPEILELHLGWEPLRQVTPADAKATITARLPDGEVPLWEGPVEGVEAFMDAHYPEWREFVA